VTRRVCEKNRPNWNQNHFFQNKLQAFSRGEKVCSQNLGYSDNFQKTKQRKKSPNRRKFAQSGHPGTYIDELQGDQNWMIVYFE
jgi:hypothetical protein